MAVLGSSVATLVDIAKRTDPDGKIARVAERLNQSNQVLDDMLWKEGNLPTGERTTVRTGLPGVAFRSLNEGVPRSKSSVSQFDEGAAMLEGFSEVDRKAAQLSGNVGQYRLDEAGAFFESMNQEMASTLFYGNAAASPKEFTGFAPRFNSLSGPTGGQIIDAGGTGTDNRSIWLVVWGDQTVRGIYPKGTKAGLFHEDMSPPEGSTLYDASGNPYVGYRDHYEWNCGLSVKDPRFVVRIANIDASLLTADKSTGADLQDLMVLATETVDSLEMGGTRAVFYAPRLISAFLRRQILQEKNAFLSLNEVGGRRVTAFDGISVRRTDALNVDEARVV